jgi:hypothetical protein
MAGARHQAGPMIVQRKPKEVWILRRPEGLEDVFAKLQGRGPLANDTETSGLRWHTDRVGAINLAANDTAIMAIEGALGPTARFVADQIRARREFVFHHAKFDLHMERETFGLHFPILSTTRGLARISSTTAEPPSIGTRTILAFPEAAGRSLRRSRRARY